MTDTTPVYAYRTVDLWEPIIRAAIIDASRHHIGWDTLEMIILTWTDRAEQDTRHTTTDKATP